MATDNERAAEVNRAVAEFGDTRLPERFWNKATENSSGCWVWNGSVSTNGYGQHWNERKIVASHRLSYEMTVGLIPEGICVLHHCDNPPCVNPSHLFLGTHADNMSDRNNKGRNADTHGENNPNAKRSADEVREMHRMRVSGSTYLQIGDSFGVPRQVAFNTINYYWDEIRAEFS